MSIKEKYEVRQIAKDQTTDWLLNKHYAHRIPPIMYAFGLYDNEKKVVGVITFATPPIQMNDGWCLFNEGDIRDKKENSYSVKTLELNRLVVNDGLEKNVLSYFVSTAIRFLEKPLVLVSFADPTNGHNGYIYQATNWIYTGKGELGGKSVSFLLNGKDIHGRGVTEQSMRDMRMEWDNAKTLHENWIANGGEIKQQEEKHRYLMFLGNKKQVSEMRKNLKYPTLSYPKGDNKRYDASYVPITQRVLF